MSKGSHDDANIAMPFNNIQVSALDSSTSVHHSMCVVKEVRDKVTTTRKITIFTLNIIASNTVCAFEYSVILLEDVLCCTYFTVKFRFFGCFIRDSFSISFINGLLQTLR